MGSVTIPTGARVYLETNSIIYSVERIAPYHALLLPVWLAAKSGACGLMTSEFTLLEVLVGPLKTGDTALETDYRLLLAGTSDVSLFAVTRSVLERSARIRASDNLKSPDAIHAATALEAGATLFITNDPVFRRVPGLNAVVLDDLLAP